MMTSIDGHCSNFASGRVQCNADHVHTALYIDFKSCSCPLGIESKAVHSSELGT